MSKVTENRLQFRKKAFESGLQAGIKAAGRNILRTSRNCQNAVKDTPVGSLAENLASTLNTFVKEEGDGTLLRYKRLAQRLANLVAEARWQTLTPQDRVEKLRQQGENFGFMAGTAVMTSVSSVFLDQAKERLARAEISDDAQKVCLSYVNDALGIILTSLSQTLDKKYRVHSRDRHLFASVLGNNEWTDTPEATINISAQGATESEEQASITS